MVLVHLSASVAWTTYAFPGVLMPLGLQSIEPLKVSIAPHFPVPVSSQTQGVIAQPAYLMRGCLTGMIGREIS